MISFEEFILEDDSPIYMQIIRYIKQGIAAGTIGDQEEAPSRRVLSALLGVNPNTIQKAYRILEDGGFRRRIIFWRRKALSSHAPGQKAIPVWMKVPSGGYGGS